MKELLQYNRAENFLNMDSASVEQQQQRNLKHDTATTLSSSSSSALVASSTTTAIMAAAAAAAASTSTQMRATLIYLAPFLHPCKNVVVPATQQQQTTSLTAPTSSLSHLSCASLGYDKIDSFENVGETLHNMTTHVARDISGLSCTPTSNGSGCVSGSVSGNNAAISTTGILRRGRVGTSNRNVMPSSMTVAGNSSSSSSRNNNNNHNNNAINCNSPTTTTINNSSINTASNVSRSCRRHCSCCRNCLDVPVAAGMSNEETASIQSNSSCCYNINNNNNNNNNCCSSPNATNDHTKDNTQDKYFENYEMPALETTTTKITKTQTARAALRTLYDNSKTKRREEDETQAKELDDDDDNEGIVVAKISVSETKTDNPSLSLNMTRTCNTASVKAVIQSHCMKQQPPLKSRNNFYSTTAAAKATTLCTTTSSSMSMSMSSSAFVNYTNNNNKRSTKYLRERERERSRRTTNMTTSHKDLSQDHKYDDDADADEQQQRRQKLHESLPLKEFQEEEEQQRTNNSCGLVCLCGAVCGQEYAVGDTQIENHHHHHQHHHYLQHHHLVDHLHSHHGMTLKCFNKQMANTSVLSRCHCINDNKNKINNNMLRNVKDNPKDNNNSYSYNILSHSHNSNKNRERVIILADKAKNTDTTADSDIDDDDGHSIINTSNLILRNSSNKCMRHETKDDIENFTTATPSVICPKTTNATTATATSFTTILNKECRCFTTSTTTTTRTLNKRDIIGSEIKENDAFSQHSLPINLRAATSSATELFYNKNYNDDDDVVDINYCLIRHSNSIKDNCLVLSTPCSSTPTSLSLLSSTSSSSLPTLMASLFGCSNQLTKMVTVSKWLFMWLLFIAFSSSAQCWAGRNDVPTNCTFPVRWEGSWFLSGYQQSIHIKGSQFSYRGRCAASDGNKYLIVDEKGCHRCLVIYEKHKNVLQYKESECEGDSMYMHQTNPSAMAMRSVLNQKPIGGNGGDHRGGAHPNLNGHSRLSSSDQYIMRSNDDMNDYFCKGRETLQNLCDQIPGDALLYSLFRESAEPVKCPLKGPFIFTYNRGNGECKSPVSNIESCTEDSRLLLSFQACPDVVGTESTVEELTCLATWKDGNSRYLVGLVSHHHAISNEERYRCFVYERTSALMDMGHFGGPSMSTSKDAEYKLAQSGDATCNGLDSAEVGSRIMSLRKPPVTERCDFPAWFKGPRHWHVLMGNAVYNYHTNDGSIHIIKPNGYMDTRALCEQINKQTATEMMSVVHYTTGCQSGFMCMVFYRRDTHIIEIQTGKPASRLEDACAADHFDINKTPYITLLASNPDPQICPLEGLYTLRGAIGPPYMTTRHKRNHNNKVHGLHTHHHQYESNERGGGYVHRRHSSLSFRNSASTNEKNAWHSNTRGLPVRARRDASSTTTKPTATAVIQTANISNQDSTEVSTTTSSPTVDDNSNVVQQQILVVGNTTNVGFIKNSNAEYANDDDTSDTRLRSRRNVPECITNYKAQRQLWIGCTEANVIDVRPMCNDEGDEEYSCHGSWSENGTVFIIARHKGTKHGVCISYRPTEGTNAKLVVGDACYRGTQKPPEHHLEANLSVFGKCGETGSTSATIPILSWLQLLMATLLITFLCQLPIQR